MTEHASLLCELGDRVQITGCSGSGKSTLAREIADALGMPFIELDALNWLPGWVGLNETDPDRFVERIQRATAGPRWVVAGSYTSFSQRTFWPRLETLIFLDLPRWLLLSRVVTRSWRRWRSGELLWGTNTESFWRQLRVWDQEDSLLWWVWTQHAKKREQVAQVKGDPRWRHIRVLHLRSRAEIAALRGALRESMEPH
jgi:adenylate kinase family enzyme